MRRDLQRNHRVHSPLAASIFISILILLSALIVNLEHKADLVVYLALFHISMDVFCTEWLCSYIGPMIGQLLTHNENTLRSHVFSFLFSILLCLTQLFPMRQTPASRYCRQFRCYISD